MYKTVRYRQRDMTEVIDEFSSAAAHYPHTRRVFLGDGDALHLTFSHLHSMLLHLNNVFPRLARVNIYANGSSILKRSTEELRELKRLKLNTLYMGLESGDQELLDKVNKQEQVKDMIQAVNTAQACGLKASVMILPGLAGKLGSTQHAAKTAAALNLMQPRLLSALRFIKVPGTKMFEGYEAVTEYQAVNELLSIIDELELDRTVFRANHSSNPIPLEGRFPQDKAKLQEELKRILQSPGLDRNGPGSLPLYL
jgi:radical SAM superfamily enzyme YgiQ (UPF0313 family)